MTDDFDYLSWEDEEDIPSEQPSLEDVELPKELVRLMEERDKLEQKLASYGPNSGAAEHQGDARFQAMFPVQQHTKESRLEEKRLKRLEEQRAFQLKRANEKQKIIEQQEALRIKIKALLERELRKRKNLQEKYERSREAAAELLKNLQKKQRRIEQSKLAEWTRKAEEIKRQLEKEKRLEKIAQEKLFESKEWLKKRVLKNRRKADRTIDRVKKLKSLADETKDIFERKQTKNGIKKQLLSNLDQKLSSVDLSPSEIEEIKQTISENPALTEVEKYQGMAQKGEQLAGVLGKANAMMKSKKSANEEKKLLRKKALEEENLAEANAQKRMEQEWQRRREERQRELLMARRQERKEDDRRERRRDRKRNSKKSSRFD